MKGDPIGKLSLSGSCYSYIINSLVKEVCPNILCTLEGGYSPGIYFMILLSKKLEITASGV